MPSRAKTTMKRKRRNNRLIIDFMELSRDTTRFLKEFQYLHTDIYKNIYRNIRAESAFPVHRQTFLMTHLVTLKILSRRRARRTLIPNEAPGLMAAQITSKILPMITCEDNLISAAGLHIFQFQIFTIQLLHQYNPFCYSSNNQTHFFPWNTSPESFESTQIRTTHPKVKTVEWGVEVVLGSEAIHFHGHLSQKQAQEYKLGQVCPGTIRKHTDQCSGLKRASCWFPQFNRAGLLLPVQLCPQQIRHRESHCLRT